MTLVFAIIAVVCIGLLVVVLLLNKKLEDKVAAANQEEERLRLYYESETQRAFSEAQAAVAEAQKQIDQQFADLKEEAERTRQHYETEARQAQEAAGALVAKTIKDFEPLRKFEKFRDAEAEAQRQLDGALKEAASLRAESQTLLDQAKAAAAEERGQAVQRAKALRDQADALLNQATRDAGRIMAEAEKRAEQIGGDAYRALREKELLEQAAEAMRNIIEGYGDRYLIPTHNLLDDLAVEFGYAAAGASLKSALDLSRRMVLQGQAAACDYVEADRRKTAVQFVIHAFNGDVASILAGVKSDNYGTLAQQIRDAFSTINKDGGAFRNARILPTYLDARLAELKWAVVVQEMARQRQEQQRDLREKLRDEALAKRAQAEKLREAEKLEELKRLAAEANERELVEAKRKLAEAAAEDKVKWGQRISELEQQNHGLRQDLAVATEQKLGQRRLKVTGDDYQFSGGLG